MRDKVTAPKIVRINIGVLRGNEGLSGVWAFDKMRALAACVSACIRANASSYRVRKLSNKVRLAAASRSNARSVTSSLFIRPSLLLRRLTLRRREVTRAATTWASFSKACRIFVISDSISDCMSLKLACAVIMRGCCGSRLVDISLICALSSTSRARKV